MKNIKRFLALFLTCAVLFSTLAGALANTSVLAASDSAPVLDADNFKRMEAEPGDPTASDYDPNNFYTTVPHWFGEPNQGSSRASGGRWVGNLGCDHNKIQKFSTLSEYFDASNTPAVTFNVNAPEAGEYEIIPGYMINKPENYPGFFMSILVNDHDAYRVKFAAGESPLFNINSIKVSLSAGNNVIRLIPVVAENKSFLANGDWMNIDYLDVQKSLTPVSNPRKQEFNVEEAPYVVGFSTTSGQLSGDNSVAANKAGITATNLKVDDLSKLSYFSYTFDVANAGTYNMQLTFIPGESFVQDKPLWVGYIVNGVPQGTAAARRTNNAAVFKDNIIDLTVRLKKGTNVIVVTNALSKENTVSDKFAQMRYDTLTVYGSGIEALDLDSGALDPTTVTPQIEYTELPTKNFANGRAFNTINEATYATMQLGGYFYVRNNDGLDPWDPVAHQYVQTFADMKAGKFDKSSLPYLAFHVEAPTAGEYMIKPNVKYPSTLELEDIADYFFIVSVNDKNYYTVSAADLDLEGNHKAYELKVAMDAGVNVIRYIPLSKETYKYCNILWGDANDPLMFSSLMIQSDLKGISNSGNFNGVAVTGDKASYNNIGDAVASTTTAFRIEDVKNGNQGLTKFVAGGQNFDTVSQETLDDLAYIAHTFDVPKNGYYDLTLTYNGALYKNRNSNDPAVNGTAGGTGYFTVRVDGSKYKVNFCEPAIHVQAGNTAYDEVLNAANLSMYLEKGTHTVLASGIMDWKNSKGNATHHVTYLQSINVAGGMTVSANQVDPRTIPDTVTADTPTSYLEAEIFATSENFEKVVDIDKYSAANAFANGDVDADKLQAMSTLTSYLDKTNTPFVTYTVEAKEAGNYNVTPIYFLNGTTAGYSLTALVNDKQTYSIPFEQDDTKSIGWNKASTEIALEKGINIIRFIPFTAENKSLCAESAFVIDYVEVANGIEAGAAGADAEPVIGVLADEVVVNTGSSVYNNGFDSVDVGLSAMRDIASAAGITIADLTKRNIDNAAYFSFTVNAPKDGYYDISLPFVAGKKDGELNPEDYTFAVYEKGNVITKRFGATVKDAGAKTVQGIANVSLYLTAGDHPLVFLAQIPENAGKQYGWTEFTTITFGSGLTLAAQQQDPVKLNRLEAELYGETTTYGAEEWGDSYSNDYAYGNGEFGSYDAIPTEAEMMIGEYNDKYAHVTYTITSESDISADFRAVYRLGGGDINAITDDMYIWAYVINDNGTQAFKVKNGEWITANWAAGENKLITTIFDKETYDAYCTRSSENTSPKKLWVNADCVDIDDALKGKMARSKLAKRAEAETYAEVFQYNSTESGGRYSGGVAVSNGSYGYSKLYTEEQYMNGEYLNQPHLIYSLDVERDDLYQLSAGYSFGSNGNAAVENNIYLIVNNLNAPAGVKNPVAYKQSGSGAWVENVQLYAGKVEVIVTIFDQESYDRTGPQGQNHTWINHDYIDFYHEDLANLEEAGLEYGIKISTPELAVPEDITKYTRFEAENIAYSNYYNNRNNKGTFSMSSSMSPEVVELAQTAASMKANGLDSSITPYAMYLIDVPEDGEYEIRIGTAYKTYGTSLPDGYKGIFGLFVNDDSRPAEMIEFAIPDLRLHFFTHTTKVNLKAGRNTIKVTSATRDSYYEEKTDSGYELATLTIYQDYLDVACLDATATPPESIIEAESSVLKGYSAEDRGGASGGQRACNEQFSRIISADVTFDKLLANSEYLAFTSYVEYKIVAPTEDAEGNPITEEILYPIIYRGSSGKSGAPLTDDVFFAVSVNDAKFKKLNYRVFGTGGTYTRVDWVALKPGENKLVTSCILKDIIASDGNLYYIDHDCIYLPAGFAGIEPEIIPPGAGDDNMEVSGVLNMAGNPSNIKPADVYVVDSENNKVTNFTYRAKVGAYYDRDLAVSMVEDLKYAGYDAQIVLIDGDFVVYVGSFNTLAQAEALAATLYSEGYAESATAVPVIITDNGSGYPTGTEGTSPSTGENLLLVLPMLLAFAAICGMYAFFRNKKKAADKF